MHQHYAVILYWFTQTYNATLFGYSRIRTLAMMIFVKYIDNLSITRVLFLFYVIGVFFLTLLLREPGLQARAILNPFRVFIDLGKDIRNGWGDAAQAGVWRALKKDELRITEIILNILLFMPFGYLLPVINERMRFWWKILLVGFGFSLAIELIQFVTHMGCFDVADLMHNTIGSILGFWVYRKWLHEKDALPNEYEQEAD